MKIGLHTARVADWDRKNASPLNNWQKVAKSTRGILTPGNLASLGGGMAAVYGLWLIMDGEVVNGLIFLAAGRIADIADGIIADYTKTKSPLGETVDATIDKLVVALSLIVLGALQLVPWWIILIVAFQNIVNVFSSVLAKLRNRTLHPSRLGKISAAFSWFTIIAYPLGDWLRQDIAPSGGSFLVVLSLISFAFYLVLGFQASLGYALAVYKKPARKLMDYLGKSS